MNPNLENYREIGNHFILPRRISRLGELAYNLWFSWNPDAVKLYTLIDKQLWERVGHNPVAFLRQVTRPRLNAVTNDHFYLELYDRVLRSFDQYMKPAETWFMHNYPELTGKLIAYFSFEFGLHESLPVYAGGLGVLSGDHVKEASDLGMPLVAVGFIYRQGYFQQHISEDGWQETRSLELNLDEMPAIPLNDENGKPLTVQVRLPGRCVNARLWEVRVGRVSLILLDTDMDGNDDNDRKLTSRLYSSDPDTRIAQEMLLGMGGVRALRLLGYEPNVWHMNEGHSAFLTIERLIEYVESGVSLDEAKERLRKSNVFTTHTPVPAGNDQFPLWLIDKYFSSHWPSLGLTRDEFIEMARQQQDWGDTFSMPVLAMKLSQHLNAVSELHGQVSRKMWHWLWPDRKLEDVPITHITNGVHTGTWLARRMRVLFDRYLGSDWMRNIDDPSLWAQVDSIPDGELWAVRRHLKRKLMMFATARARQQWLNQSVHPVQVIAGGVLMDPYALTIGFARRFATYKRGNLLMRDFDRLLRIINNPYMPVQVVFAGKAHPADEPGKLLIQQVYRAVKDARTGGRLVFIEDYEMDVARHLVQGVDVWLNNPRRPNEASGTSGEKAAINGVLNFSVLDGWWQEGYNGRNGWAIGSEREYADPNEQDAADAESLYSTLENEIVPLFYNIRASDGLPGEWIAKMKESIRTLAPQFSMRRMLIEYMNTLYLPAIEAEESAAEGS